ncbi:WD40 repeat-like protein, partial [Meira miltonrushii]
SANGLGNGTNGVNGIDDDFASNTFTPLYEGSSLDRREFIRITVQSLRELGLESSAKSLELESGISLEHPSIIGFRSAILSGDWKNAERLLLDGLTYGASRMMARMGPSAPETSRNGALSMASSSSAVIDLALRDPHSRGIDWIKFLIYQQRYLELLESKQTRKALSVLRDRLAPLNHGSDTLHQLSSLVICGTPEELCERANWLGSGLASRRKLLEEIETAISPSVMIPSRRLPQLLEQAQQLQKSRDPFFNLPLDTRISLYVDHQSDRSVFPTRTAAVLTEHNDEVWHVSFSNDGTKLASVGMDHEVLVWSVGTAQSDFQVVNRLGPTTGHICHVSFSPDDAHLLATSDDGEVIVWNLHDGTKQEYKGHTYAVGTGAWMPDGQGFVTGGMDRKVCFWDIDLGLQRTWNTGQFRVQAIDVSPDGRYLVAVSHRYVPNNATGGVAHQTSTSTTSRIAAQFLGTAWFDYPSPAVHDEEWHMARSHDEHDLIDLGGGARTMTNERFQLHFYDIRRKEDVGSIYMMEEMTSVSFSDDSKYVLINQRPNDALIWDVQKQSLVHRFTGHRIHQHVIRSCFGGAENSFVISGSEDGSIYVYHRKTGKLLDRLRGHSKGSVNSVAWHPRQHNMFASCGDDGTIRIWRP